MAQLAKLTDLSACVTNCAGCRQQRLQRGGLATDVQQVTHHASNGGGGQYALSSVMPRFDRKPTAMLRNAQLIPSLFFGRLGFTSWSRT
jgi:hypothetical protein